MSGIDLLDVFYSRQAHPMPFTIFLKFLPPYKFLLSLIGLQDSMRRRWYFLPLSIFICSTG